LRLKILRRTFGTRVGAKTEPSGIAHSNQDNTLLTAHLTFDPLNEIIQLQPLQKFRLSKGSTFTMKLTRLLMFSVLALLWAANAHAGFFQWDVNGTAGGSGGPSPSGTWNTTTPNFAADDSGTTPSDPNGGNSAFFGKWENDGLASVAFSAGVNATGSYTITVDNSGGQILVHDMHCDDGSPILAGGPLKIVGDLCLISAFAGHTFTINCPLAKDPGNGDGFHKYKPGTLILGAVNTYSGSTTIEGGVIKLNGNQRIPSTSNLILANGDTRQSDSYQDTPATFNTGGFNQTLGTLLLTGPNPAIARTIDFENGQGTLSFADSSALDWSGIPLYIANYVPGTTKLRFGTSSNGLTPTQLSLLQFTGSANLPGVIDSAGYVTPSLPVLQSVTVSGQAVQITWSAVTGKTYRLHYRDNLSSAWQILGDYFASTDSITVNDTFSPPSRYYRVEVLP
jgi:autotransporter-associated beta strand protein